LKRTLQLLAVAVALCAAAPAAAKPVLTRLPAEFRGGDVFLRVDLNGRKLWLKLDISGAPSSLSPQAAATLGLGAARNADLQIGAVGFSSVAFRREAGETCTGPDGAPLAGVLGEDFLGDRPLWIDTIHRQVWISPPV
jgi:hypothetical protein